MEKRAMSYINEALKKAQKEKDTLYRRYREFLNGQGDEMERKKSRWKTPVILGALCIMIVAITAAYLLQGKTNDGGNNLRHAVVQSETGPVGKQEKPAASQGPPIATIKPSQPAKQSGPGRTQFSNASRSPITPSADVPAAAKPIPPAATPSPSSGISPSEASSQSVINKKLLQRQNQAPVKTPSSSTSPSPRQLYQQALACQRSNNLTMAERLYLRILKVDPRFVSAMNNLGVIYMSQNKYRNAQQLFQNAIAIDNDYVDPYYNLACIYTLTGKTAEGLAYLKKAIAIKKDVKKWAKNDRDLGKLRNLSEFAELMGTSAAVSRETEDIYIVKKGEWIFEIVRKYYGVSDTFVPDILKIIEELNPEMMNSDFVYPGQKLLIPSRESIKKRASTTAQTDNK